MKSGKYRKWILGTVVEIYLVGAVKVRKAVAVH
jgi:hypothetical protein